MEKSPAMNESVNKMQCCVTVAQLTIDCVYSIHTYFMLLVSLRNIWLFLDTAEKWDIPGRWGERLLLSFCIIWASLSLHVMPFF